jgi:hypothetical protein
MVPTTKLTKSVHSYMWVFVRNGHKVKTNLYTTTLHVNIATILLLKKLFDHKVCIRPNPDKFAKVVHNVMYGSPLHSKGIGLEDDTCSMFMKRKLDGNSHIINKGTFTFSIPINNCLPTFSH